jgi:hypothetical protein
MPRLMEKLSMSGTSPMRPEQIELICAQISQATADATKIEAETEKIKAETTKILLEHSYYPKLAVGTLLVSAVAAGAAIAKLWLDG